MTALTVAEVLRKAEQVIGDRGWCQEDFEIGRRVCARGAINVVVTGEPYEGPDPERLDPLAVAATEALARHLGRYWNGRYKYWAADVSDWNDEDVRTEDDVRAALLAAADEAGQS